MIEANPATVVDLGNFPKTDKIIVTGFGPFAGHELVNASWEAIRLLPDTLQIRDTSYKIEKKLVSVIYDDVNTAVDEIWSKKPMLVIHCGVHAGTNCIRVEELAYNHKFIRRDYAGKRLNGASACLRSNDDGSCDRLYTKLDVKKIVENTSLQCACKDSVTTSEDVGNYLCGYIYLKSLDRDCNRSLFIHVPPIDQPFTSKQTSDIIKKIIIECVCQIEDNLTLKQTI